MIDCHAHLGAAQFDECRSEVIQRAKEAGVSAIIVVPCSFNEFEKTLKLVDTYPDILVPALGLHPIQGPYGCPEETRAASESHFDEAVAMIERHHERLVCIGECGLDFTRKFIRRETDKSDQLACLRRQIQLAKRFDLPLNLHSRSAAPQIFKLLDEEDYYKCVFHAYGGKAKTALRYAKERGVCFSVPGTAAKDGAQMQKLIQLLPLDNILLETDSPALSLLPGTTNEPANIIHSVRIIAQIKQLDESDVIAATTRNALRLFPRLSRLLLKV